MDIKSLLTNNMNPQAKLMAETRGLQGKWEKTGLLEGCKGVEKAHMSILLENQAKQLLDEATTTGTSTSSEQWAGVALPLVRRVFAEIAAKEFVSVQPMNLPSGLIFYLDFKYGTNAPGTDLRNLNNGSSVTTRAGKQLNDSLFGGTGKKLGSTDDAVRGLYGQGAFAYSVRPVSSSAITIAYSPTATNTGGTIQTASWNDVQFAAELSSSVHAKKLFKVILNHDDNNTPVSSYGNLYNVDLNAVRSFNLLSGSTATNSPTPLIKNGLVLNTYSKAVNTGSLSNPFYQTVYIVSASQSTFAGAAGGPKLKLIYSLQPTDNLRGDFEAGKTAGEGSGTSANVATQSIDTDISIPEVNLVLNSEPIVAKTRKLKAVWTPELAQDLNAYHSIDAEAELTALLSEYVSMEIDLEILEMLNGAVQGITTEAWSAQIGVEFSKGLNATTGDAVFTRNANSSPNRTAYVKSTWFQTLGNKIQKVSNTIQKLTLRGGANFLVVSPDVATILESIPGYVVNTDGDSAKFAMGVARVGSFASRFQVYKNPYMTDNIVLVGFRGNNFLETGAVYAPYIPLIQTPLVYDPVNFTPRRGVMTRYAKKVVRPEFYGKVIIGDLDTV
jgi:hypothetical protein